MHHKKISLFAPLVLLAVLCIFTASCSSNINQKGQVSLNFSEALFNQLVPRSVSEQVTGYLKIKVELKTGGETLTREIALDEPPANAQTYSTTFEGLTVGSTAQLFLSFYAEFSNAPSIEYASGQTQVFTIKKGLNEIPVILKLEEADLEETEESDYPAAGTLIIDNCVLDIEFTANWQIIVKDKNGTDVTNNEAIEIDVQVLYKGQDVSDFGLDYCLDDNNRLELENPDTWPKAQYDLFVTAGRHINNNVLYTSESFVFEVK